MRRFDKGAMMKRFGKTSARWIVAAAALALMVGLGLAACSKALQEVPEAFKKGYEAAEFEKFNSPAEENGLGDTRIWIEGMVGEIKDLDLGISGIAWYTIVKDKDGKEWYVILDYDYLYPNGDGKQKYTALKGHTACITSVYMGYSSVYEAPAIMLIRLFDENTGEIVASKAGTATYGFAE